MDWLLKSPQIQSIFSSLGSTQGDKYTINSEALSILEDINCQLIYEDQTLRTFRRAIGFGQHVRTDLIPLLINTNDPEILDAGIRILVNLTVPVECLFCVDIMYRTEVGRCTIFELNKLLITSKEAFSDAKSTKAVIDRIKTIVESDSKNLSVPQSDSINNCLLLLRNILHIPETSLTGPHSSGGSNCGNGSGTTSLQNVILWNLFIQSVDKLLIYLMSCTQRSHWGVTIVQLIALMYKDQHVSTLQKLLNNWFEASLSDSSEDNESNTTTLLNKGSGESSPMLTSSDPTSDSSDNGGGSGKKEASDERRQSTHNKDTEATLQEVSRKGYEYQNAISRVLPNNNNNNTNNNSSPQQQQQQKEKQHQKQQTQSQPPQSPQQSNQQPSKTKPENHKNNKKNKKNKKIEMEITKNDEKQPEQPINKDETPKESPLKPKSIQSNTSNTTNTSQQQDIFVPPPVVKTKIEKMKSTFRAQQNQKSPHSGLLHIGALGPQKRECPSSNSELSDCGYSTQVENQEAISTSSNDDDGPTQKPVHQKPPCNQKPRPKQWVSVTPQDKNEWRRKKLVKRSKSNLINMKGLVQHSPTDEDISKILKEFTVDFLLKGYGHLVHELHAQLLQDYKSPIDTSHFFWLVTYFLKFATQLELDLELVNSVLNFDIVSYLTFEGVTLCEQLEFTSRQEGGDMKPYLRRVHLVVTAIREFLQAVETYKKNAHLTKEDSDYLHQLELQIGSTEDLRSLFLLLIRRFSPALHSRQYLQDIIVTNHILLVFLDSVNKSDDQNLVGIKMTEHIAQFATVDVMYHYGLLLEDFRDNGEYINDCIFTMLHHIGGDLEQVSTLFQPVLLKTFSRIWETEYEVCDDWSDLIEYVINKFMNTPQKNSLAFNSPSLTQLIKEHNMENTDCTWTQEEKDTLYWYYVQSKKSDDTVGKIQKYFKDNGNRQKSRISIIQQLLQQDIITLVAYDDLMKYEDIKYEKTIMKRKSSTNSTESGIDVSESSGSKSYNHNNSNSNKQGESNSSTSDSTNKAPDDIQILRNLLIKDGKTNMLNWLQKLLLEACYVRLNINAGKKNCKDLNNGNHKEIHIMESVSHHSILKMKSIPLVPWNTEQSLVMMHQPFILLLHKLGFNLPIDAGSVFARIPEFWTADLMYKTAQKLGPIDKNLIKFDLSLLSDIEEQTLNFHDDNKSMIQQFDDTTNDSFPVHLKHTNSILRFTPNPALTSSVPNWLQNVMKSKCTSNLTATTNGSTDNRSEVESSSAVSAANITATVPTALKSQTSVDSGFAVPTSALKIDLFQTCNAGILSDEDSFIRSSDDQHDNSSGYQTRRSSNLESEYSAIVASVYESELININCETESISSDLTRMYVSDEDTAPN